MRFWVTSTPTGNPSDRALSYPNHGSRRAGGTSFTLPSSVWRARRDGSRGFRCRRRVPPATSGICTSRLKPIAGAPEKFFEHTPWFTNVEKMILFGLIGSQLSRSPSFARLPQSMTSLTISSGTISLLQLRDVMVQLPNTDDFSLLGSLVTVDRNTSPGIGTALRGRFGGQLRLQKGYAETDVINMLLEVPTGLRFTEVQIHSRSVSLSPTVRLAEACGNTLVKLSYAVTIHGKSLPSSWVHRL